MKDDVSGILDKMMEADGLILASPNYINHITGSMKTLLDRSAHFIHCSRLREKYVAGVVTSGSGRGQDVLNYMAHYSHVCGAQFSGGVSSSVPIGDDKISEAFTLGTRLAVDIRKKRQYAEQLEKIEQFRRFFTTVMDMRKDEWTEEYQYWQEQGWC